MLLRRQYENATLLDLFQDGPLPSMSVSVREC